MIKQHKNSLFWALERLARAQGTLFDPLQLQASVDEINNTENANIECLEAVCHRLGIGAPNVVSVLDQAQLPVLCCTQNGDWGVVEDREPNGQWVFSSSTRTESIDDDEIKGRCYVVRCNGSGFGRNETEPTAIRPQKFKVHLNSALREYRKIIMEVCAASAFIGMLALATSLFSMQVYDRVIPTRSEYTLIVLSVGVVICVLVELAMKFARASLLDNVITGLDARLSKELFHQLLRLRVDQIPSSVGSLAAQLRSYEQVRGFYTSSTLFALVDLPIAACFLGVVAFLATPLLALTIFIFALISLAIGLSIRRRVTHHAREGIQFSNMKTGLLVEAVEGAETIKAGNGGWKFLSRWIKINELSIKSDLQMRHTSDSTGYFAGATQQLSYSALIIVGASVVMNGEMTMGALIACSILSGRILNPIIAIPGLMVQHAYARAAIDGLEKIYALEIDHAGLQRPLIPEKITGAYSFKDVIFSYGENPAALSIPSLSIKPGEKIAILGPVGAGKSTLLRLMSGIYVPRSGRLLLDGLELQHISRQILGRQIGYLQQDHRLFQGTLRENLLIGLPDPGDEVLLQALRRTGMDRIVSTHPKGLDRLIMEGGKGLSGGQRQLLAFTRLFLCKPDVLLLDEPTAAMDEDQERRCLSILAEETRSGKTMVIVTHKTSLLHLVDRVIIVVGSDIVMDGPRNLVLQRIKNASAGNTTASPPKNQIAESTL